MVVVVVVVVGPCHPSLHPVVLQPLAHYYRGVCVLTPLLRGPSLKPSPPPFDTASDASNHMLQHASKLMLRWMSKWPGESAAATTLNWRGSSRRTRRRPRICSSSFGRSVEMLIDVGGWWAAAVPGQAGTPNHSLPTKNSASFSVILLPLYPLTSHQHQPLPNFVGPIRPAWSQFTFWPVRFLLFIPLLDPRNWRAYLQITKFTIFLLKNHSVSESRLALINWRRVPWSDYEAGKWSLAWTAFLQCRW